MSASSSSAPEQVTTDFLKNLRNLSKSEKSTILKFENDATGASFVPVADLLRERGYIEEAIVILEDGLLKYPQYSSARASLAKDYFSLGMLQEALIEANIVLEQGPDNALAQRLSLKLLVLFDKREAVLGRLKNIGKVLPDDDITLAIRNAVGVGDWNAAQKWVKTDLEKSGVSVPLNLAEANTSSASVSSFGDTVDTVQLPERNLGLKKSRDGVATGQGSSWQLPSQVRSGAAAGETVPLSDSSLPSAGMAVEETENLPEALRTGSTLGHVRGDVDRYLLLKGFRSVELGGFFLGRDSGSRGRVGGVERKTLAEIYRSQKMYLKAMEIYETLLQEEPRNFELHSAYQELRELVKGEYFSGQPKQNSPSLHHADPDVEASKRKIEALRAIIGRMDNPPLSSEGGTAP